MMDRLKTFLLKAFPSDPRTGRIGSMELNIQLAKWTGLPLIGLSDDESKWSTTILQIYGVGMIGVVTFFYTIYEFCHLILNWDDLYALTQNSCLSLTHLTGVIKIINTLWRLPEIRQLVETLKKTTRKFVVSPKQCLAFHQGEFENKLLLTIYASMVATTGIMGIIMLMVSPEGFAGEMFPYCVKLPNWIPYPLQLVYMGVSVLFLALQIVSIDYLNVGMINQLRYQLDILILSFNELNLKRPYTTHINSNMQSYAILKSITEHHCILIEMRNQVEKIYRFPILIQFLTSLIIFAMTGFRATVSTGDMSGDGIIFLYCGCIFCELFFYCWFGNEVFEKSKALSTSSFSIRWYELDDRFKSSLLIFITNAQRTFIFTAGGFMSLSLPSFAGILSKSYSYIALLRQIYDN